MKFLLQEQVIQAICDKTVPPAEVIPDQKHRSSGCVHGALEPDILEMPLQAGPGIEAEKPDKESYMPCLYYHFDTVTGTSDPAGLRYDSGITGNPPSSDGLNF